MKTARRISTVLALTGVLVGASFGPRPEDPVVAAARQGDLAALRALIAKGAEVNQSQGDGMTALHWAAMRNDVEAASLLIEAGAPLDAVTRLGEHTPLHVASQSGSAAVVRALLESGRAVVDARTATGATPLHLASGAGHAEVAELTGPRRRSSSRPPGTGTRRSACSSGTARTPRSPPVS
jgi:ankyrin repeat protein